MYILAPNTSGYILRVESDGEYSGTVDHVIVSGGTTKSFPVHPRVGHAVCWNIRKHGNNTGMLRAFLTYRDYHTGSSVHPRHGDQVTLLPRGHVTGCHRVM